MTETETLAARIDALEIHIAHQDQTLEDLNATITDQWKQIEDLAYRVSRLGEQMRSKEAAHPIEAVGSKLRAAMPFLDPVTVTVDSPGAAPRLAEPVGA